MCRSERHSTSGDSRPNGLDYVGPHVQSINFVPFDARRHGAGMPPIDGTTARGGTLPDIGTREQHHLDELVLLDVLLQQGVGDLHGLGIQSDNLDGEEE